MNIIYILTVIVNFTGMVSAVWLVIYLVSRSPRSPITRLTALALFSVSVWFLNVFPAAIRSLARALGEMEHQA